VSKSHFLSLSLNISGRVHPHTSLCRNARVNSGSARQHQPRGTHSQSESSSYAATVCGGRLAGWRSTGCLGNSAMCSGVRTTPPQIPSLLCLRARNHEHTQTNPSHLMQLIKACVGRERVKNVIFHKAAAPCVSRRSSPLLGIARFSHSEVYVHKTGSVFVHIISF
jgi:hypothetical protein